MIHRMTASEYAAQICREICAVIEIINARQEKKMHPSNKVTLENLKEVVYWHRPNSEAIKKFETVAKASEEFMKVILENATDCADRSTALRCVREARMWTNAAISLDPANALPIDHERNNE